MNTIFNTANRQYTLPTKLNELFNMIMDKAKEILNVPTSNQISNIDWSSIASIISTISIILIISLIVTLVLYFLRAIALYKMAQDNDRSFAWLAFIPFGCFFIYGIILKKTKLFNIEIDHPELLLPALLLSSFLPYVGPFASILFIICKFGLLYRIYESKVPNFATVLLLLSILVPILPPIILFSIRKK